MMQSFSDLEKMAKEIPFEKHAHANFIHVAQSQASDAILHMEKEMRGVQSVTHRDISDTTARMQYAVILDIAVNCMQITHKGRGRGVEKAVRAVELVGKL